MTIDIGGSVPYSIMKGQRNRSKEQGSFRWENSRLESGACEFKPSSSYLDSSTRIFNNDSQYTTPIFSTILEIICAVPKVTMPLIQYTIIIPAMMTYLDHV